MGEPARDEFYVGYLPKAPPNQARHTLVVVLVHLVLGMIVATAVVASMRDPGRGVWEDGTPREYEGVLVQRPYPMLRLDESAPGVSGRVVMLVDFGKRGAQGRVGAIQEGARVRVSGYPLMRDGRTMVELAPEEGAVARVGERVVRVERVMGERVTLRGEVVDSKCFLGAMKPGDGKTHQACAVRCISGGIPPVLACWDGAGRVSYYVIAGPEGEAWNAGVLGYVGEPVEVTGSIERVDEMMILRVSAGGIVRL